MNAVCCPHCNHSFLDTPHVLKHTPQKSFLIEEVICCYFDITEEQIKGHTREPEVVRGRSILFYMLYTHLEWNQDTIAKKYLRQQSAVSKTIREVEEWKYTQIAEIDKLVKDVLDTPERKAA